MKKLARHLDDYVEVYLASVALCVFAALVIVQVFMRYVLGRPLTWSEELARYALVWFVWIAGSYAVKHLRHVRFNVLVDAVGRRWPVVQRVVRLLVFVLWLAFLGLMLVLSVQQVQQQVASGQVSPATRVPISLVYSGLSLGMLLMTVRVLQHTVGAAVELVKTPNAPITRPSEEVE